MKWLCLSVAMFGLGVQALPSEPFPAIYSELSDLYNPTLTDFRTIQSALNSAERPLVRRLKDTEHVLRSFKLIGNCPEEEPRSGWLTYGCDQSLRESCVVLYASFNERYPKGIERILEKLAASDFIGHLHYRIGGWPNVEAGDLALAHVPYAFKVCSFREMKRLGYKRVLWLDASIIPFVSLNHIFRLINRDGYFVQDNSHSVGVFMHEEAAAAFGLTLEETYQIPSCSAAILGIDFTNPQAERLIDRWYEAAKHPLAFYSARSDQNALSILLWQQGFRRWASSSTLGGLDCIRPGTLFLMNREYVKEIR